MCKVGKQDRNTDYIDLGQILFHKSFLILNYRLTIAIAHFILLQGSHRLEKYLNIEGFLEKSLNIKSALKSTGKSLKSLEKSLNSTIFCRT